MDKSILSTNSQSFLNSSVNNYKNVTQADFTSANIGLFLQDDPGLSASEQLFEDFMSCCVDLSSENQALELVEQFEQLCEYQCQLLKKVIKRAGPSQKFNRTVSVLQQIDMERCTWRLIKILYQDRMKSRKHMDIDEHLTPLLTDGQCFEALLNENGEFREMKLIIDWCEQNYVDKLDSLDLVAHSINKQYLYDNTLHELKKPRTGKALTKKALDPDAHLRKAVDVKSYDVEDEQYLLTIVFQLIRCGCVDQAIEVCVQSGEAWRASTLQGLKLHLDSNINQRGELNILSAPIGNHKRDACKALCWKLVQDSCMPLIERAIYGAASGHLSSILPQCATWQDHLWAYCTCTIQCKLDAEMRSMNRLKPLTPLPPSEDDQRDYTLQEIIQEIHTFLKKQPGVSEDPHCLVQKYVMLNRANDVITSMYDWLKECSGSISGHIHILRFMAHVVLLFRRMGLKLQDGLSNGITEMYIDQLVQQNRHPLIAFYTSFLPVEQQITVYANFCQGLLDEGARISALELAEQFALNVASICMQVVDNLLILFKTTPNPVNDTFDSSVDSMDQGEVHLFIPNVPFKELGLNSSDQQIVTWIDWLLYNPELRMRAIRMANNFCRYLILSGRSGVAFEMMQHMPTDSISVATNESLRSSEDGQQSYKDYNCVRQFICIKTYLECLDDYGRWSYEWNVSKPTAMDKVDLEQMTFTERAVHENREKQHKQRVEKWKFELERMMHSLTKKLHTVLNFPEANWMTHLHKEIGEEGEGGEMNTMRINCIPQIANMLIKVYKQHALFKQAIQVADEIADQERKLYQYFESDKLENLLNAIAECSNVAQGSGKNHLGH